MASDKAISATSYSSFLILGSSTVLLRFNTHRQIQVAIDQAINQCKVDFFMLIIFPILGRQALQESSSLEYQESLDYWESGSDLHSQVFVRS